MPPKDPEALRAYRKRYYQENKDKNWKHPDGRWKVRMPEQRNAWYRKKYATDPEWREKQLANGRRQSAKRSRTKYGKCPLCFKEKKLFYDTAI